MLVTAASNEAAAQQEGVDSTDVVPLQPVVVSVLRTPFPVTDAPFAVAANTQDEIQRGRPGLGLDEALGGIPGVQVDDRFNLALGDRISIRGFGARTPFGVRGVKILVDGIPATLPDGTTNLSHLDLGFLRRVEVIRGPASSLYGNAAGGVIQFETELPPATPFAQQLGFTAGSDGLFKFQSTTGGRSGNADYNLNISRLTYDGYRAAQHHAENIQVNGSAGLPVAGGDLRITGAYVDYTGDNPGSLNQAMLDEDPMQVHPIYTNGNTSEDGTQAQLGAAWALPVGAGQIRASAYGLTREIYNPIPFNVIDIERFAGGLGLTYQSTTDALPTDLSWSVGTELDIQQDQRLNFGQNFGGVVETAPSIDQDEQVLGAGFFAQLSLKPTDRLTGLGGLRYDITRFEADDHLITADDPDDSGDRTMDLISPSVGLSYAAADIANIYANIATSFETPTTTELANQESGAGGFNPNLEPQKTVSYELGLKGLLPARFSYQLAAYRANIYDALIPFIADERTYFRNAGEAIHQGIEAGLTFAPMPGLTANAAYTYVDAYFDNYAVGSDIFDDNKIPGVSPHHFDGSLSFSSDMGFYVSGNFQYVDEMPVNDSNSASAPSYSLVGFRAGLDEVRFGSLVFEPFAGVTNLLDEEYVTSPSVNHQAGRYFEPGPGRAIYGGGQIRFEAN